MAWRIPKSLSVSFPRNGHRQRLSVALVYQKRNIFQLDQVRWFSWFFHFSRFFQLAIANCATCSDYYGVIGKLSNRTRKQRGHKQIQRLPMPTMCAPKLKPIKLRLARFKAPCLISASMYLAVNSPIVRTRWRTMPYNPPDACSQLIPIRLILCWPS